MQINLLAESIQQQASLLNTFSEPIITTLVTNAITILGFVFTYTSIKKSFKNEISKQRQFISLDKISSLPYDIIELFDEMKKSKNIKEEFRTKHAHIYNSIYCYGSKEAIKIAATMQKESYNSSAGINSEKYRMLCQVVLLVTQLKYDATEEAISPKYWYEMRITDYDKIKDEIENINNKLVEELQLNPEFRI